MSGLLAGLRPFGTMRFARLLLNTVQLKIQYRHMRGGDYRSYLKRYYARLHTLYWEQVYEDKWQQVRPIVLQLAGLRAGERALDVATGAGFQAVAFSEQGHFVVGLDYVYDRLRMAAARNPANALSWVGGDAVWLPFPSGAFAAAIISLALHDMPAADVLSALREARRVASRRVVIVEPRLPRRRILRPIYHLLAGLFDESLWINQYLDGDIETWFAQANLRLCAVEPCYWGALVVYACEV